MYSASIEKHFRACTNNNYLSIKLTLKKALKYRRSLNLEALPKTAYLVKSILLVRLLHKAIQSYNFVKNKPAESERLKTINYRQIKTVWCTIFMLFYLRRYE